MDDSNVNKVYDIQNDRRKMFKIYRHVNRTNKISLYESTRIHSPLNLLRFDDTTL